MNRIFLFLTFALLVILMGEFSTSAPHREAVEQRFTDWTRPQTYYVSVD